MPNQPMAHALHSQIFLICCDRGQGLLRLSDLDDKTRMLLQLRTGLVVNEGTLCLHHEQLYIKKYAFLQKSCCESTAKHKKQVLSSLKTLDEDAAAYVSKITGVSVKPGQKLCYNCFKALRKFEKSQSETEGESQQQPETESDPEEIDFSNQAENLSSEDESALPHDQEVINRSFEDLGVSPLRATRISLQNKPSYAKRKYSEFETAFSNKVARVLEVEPQQLSQAQPQAQQCSNCNDMDRLVELLKEKMQVSSKQKQVQLLTLAPESWTIEKVVEEFKVSTYKVKEARKLKKEFGILADPKVKVGRPLPKEIEERVINFYQDEQHSRLLPGKKDFKSVKGPDGKRQHVQKRLLLMNLNELYETYKAKHPKDKIGLSTFCALCPSHCITVGCRGTHSVCVCTIHQNVKLMLSALPTDNNITVTYHDLMEKMVCSVESKMCMIHRCPACPGTDGLLSYLESLCNSHAQDEIVHFKQWLTVDRTTLQDCSKQIDEFIEHLVEKCDNLTSHHFIAKHQSKYLSDLKENLKPEEAIVILDFAENYSFVIQDAAQGFHWDNSQATLHPFVAYYKNEDQLEHISMCVISDCLKHDTITVHSFLQVVLPYLKDCHPVIKHIHYFSDGAASQYKNYKNFCNLLYHYSDFGLEAEWNFFATSHGKNCCDGVGGTVKREAAKASLQAVTSGHITTPSDLYNWASANIVNVKFFFVGKNEVTANIQQQEKRFQNANTVAGTRSHHCFVAQKDEKKLLIKRISGNEPSFEAVVFQHPTDSQTTAGTNSIQLRDCEIGKYVACAYDGNWWIGLIRETSENEGDVQISFLHPHGPAASFHWPSREDICYVPLQCILRVIVTPSTPNGRQYYLDNEDKKALR